MVCFLPNNALESRLVPLDGLNLGDLMSMANPRLSTTALGNTLTGAGHAAVKVHSVDTNRRIVLDAQIDMFADTEAKVSSLREVALSQFVFLDLEATLENLFRLGATNRDVDGNLFVAADAKSADGVTGLAVDGSLTAELFEHLGRSREPVTRLADGDVEDKFLDTQSAHGVGGVVLFLGHCVHKGNDLDFK